MAPMKSAMKAKKVAMKAMKGQKAMTKGALLGELATATEMKKSDITKVLNTLTEIGTQEVKKSGKFVLPGLCMIKTRQKAKGLGWDGTFGEFSAKKWYLWIGDFPHTLKEIMNMPENQSHPKDIWSKNSTSPYEFLLA